MWPKDLISVDELTAADFAALFESAAAIKATPQSYRTALDGQTLGLIFQKSSTRTRVSFEVGMFQLGRGETIEDTAKVLSRYVNGVMARTFAHQDVVDLARFGSIPVINGLTDDLHPCQALTDYFTLTEVFGGVEGLAGRKIAYVGDGNNMAHSLMLGAPKVGMDISVAAPDGYQVQDNYLEQAYAAAAAAGTSIEITSDPAAAVDGASAVYTDVWASMGQEEEARERLRAFEGFTVDAELMARAKPEAIFLHCLPAHRGEEVAAEVADGPQSRIFDQAENRLHVQKAVLVRLMGSN